MKLLAFDTSAEGMHIALSRSDGAAGTTLWQHQGSGGAQASGTLIASILALLQDSGMALRELDAICFGCGPGYFTGLRTACAVAQGLAFGAEVPVLPVPTLLAVAEAARHAALGGQPCGEVLALLDARMDEVYSARYAFHATDTGGLHWTELQAARLCAPEALVLAQDGAHLPGRVDAGLAAPQGRVAAGNVFAVYGARLQGLPQDLLRIEAQPQAAAMLRLAPQLLAQGCAVPADQALPLYVRDKVAQTTSERLATRGESVRSTEVSR